MLPFDAAIRRCIRKDESFRPKYIEAVKRPPALMPPAEPAPESAQLTEAEESYGKWGFLNDGGPHAGQLYAHLFAPEA